MSVPTNMKEPIQSIAFFSTNGGRTPTRAVSKPLPSVIARSDPKRDAERFINDLRAKWPHECNAVFAPWDIRWFFDEHDFYEQGGQFLYENVLMEMTRQNEEKLIRWTQLWSECNKMQFHALVDLDIDKLFHENDHTKYGRAFLERALDHMRKAYQQAHHMEIQGAKAMLSAPTFVPTNELVAHGDALVRPDMVPNGPERPPQDSLHQARAPGPQMLPQQNLLQWASVSQLQGFIPFPQIGGAFVPMAGNGAALLPERGPLITPPTMPGVLFDPNAPFRQQQHHLLYQPNVEEYTTPKRRGNAGPDFEQDMSSSFGQRKISNAGRRGPKQPQNARKSSMSFNENSGRRMSDTNSTRKKPERRSTVNRGVEDQTGGPGSQTYRKPSFHGHNQPRIPTERRLTMNQTVDERAMEPELMANDQQVMPKMDFGPRRAERPTDIYIPNRDRDLTVQGPISHEFLDLPPSLRVTPHSIGGEVNNVDRLYVFARGYPSTKQVEQAFGALPGFSKVTEVPDKYSQGPVKIHNYFVHFRSSSDTRKALEICNTWDRYSIEVPKYYWTHDYNGARMDRSHAFESPNRNTWLEWKRRLSETTSPTKLRKNSIGVKRNSEESNRSHKSKSQSGSIGKALYSPQDARSDLCPPSEGTVESPQAETPLTVIPSMIPEDLREHETAQQGLTGVAESAVIDDDSEDTLTVDIMSPSSKVAEIRSPTLERAPETAGSEPTTPLQIDAPPVPTTLTSPVAVTAEPDNADTGPDRAGATEDRALAADNNTNAPEDEPAFEVNASEVANEGGGDTTTDTSLSRSATHLTENTYDHKTGLPDQISFLAVKQTLSDTEQIHKNAHIGRTASQASASSGSAAESIRGTTSQPRILPVLPKKFSEAVRSKPSTMTSTTAVKGEYMVIEHSSPKLSASPEPRPYDLASTSKGSDQEHDEPTTSDPISAPPSTVEHEKHESAAEIGQEHNQDSSTKTDHLPQTSKFEDSSSASTPVDLAHRPSSHTSKRLSGQWSPGWKGQYEQIKDVLSDMDHGKIGEWENEADALKGRIETREAQKQDLEAAIASQASKTMRKGMRRKIQLRTTEQNQQEEEMFLLLGRIENARSAQVAELLVIEENTPATSIITNAGHRSKKYPPHRAPASPAREEPGSGSRIVLTDDLFPLNVRMDGAGGHVQFDRGGFGEGFKTYNANLYKNSHLANDLPQSDDPRLGQIAALTNQAFEEVNEAPRMSLADIVSSFSQTVDEPAEAPQAPRGLGLSLLDTDLNMQSSQTGPLIDVSESTANRPVTEAEEVYEDTVSPTSDVPLGGKFSRRSKRARTTLEQGDAEFKARERPPATVEWVHTEFRATERPRDEYGRIVLPWSNVPAAPPPTPAGSFQGPNMMSGMPAQHRVRTEDDQFVSPTKAAFQEIEQLADAENIRPRPPSGKKSTPNQMSYARAAASPNIQASASLVPPSTAPPGEPDTPSLSRRLSNVSQPASREILGAKGKGRALSNTDGGARPASAGVNGGKAFGIGPEGSWYTASNAHSQNHPPSAWKGLGKGDGLRKGG